MKFANASKLNRKSGLRWCERGAPVFPSGSGQGEETGDPQYECGGEGFWVIARAVGNRDAAIAEFRDAPVDAGEDGDVEASYELVLEAGAVIWGSPIQVQAGYANRDLRRIRFC